MSATQPKINQGLAFELTNYPANFSLTGEQWGFCYIMENIALSEWNVI